MTDRPVVAVTMGDPAGVGPEVIARAYCGLLEDARVVVVGDADVLCDAVGVVGGDLDVRAIDEVGEARFERDVIDVLDLDNVAEHEYGVVRAEYGAASLAYVERAIEAALDGDVAAITTAPINKQATALAGAEHAGHTGLLAERTGVEDYTMLLIEDDLRVTHVSTHVPLATAVERVTTERVLRTIRLTAEALCDLGVPEPTVAVAGLNPHAGDGGLLGEEDAAEIAPAVERARELNIDARGPASPDTVFARAAGDGDADCVVAMYHDQGHIPIKMLGFTSGGVTGVNVTVGLPIVRTSVDHGTAFDIAGEGIASDASLREAVAVAVQIARNRDRRA